MGENLIIQPQDWWEMSYFSGQMWLLHRLLNRLMCFQLLRYHHQSTCYINHIQSHLKGDLQCCYHSYHLGRNHFGSFCKYIVLVCPECKNKKFEMVGHFPSLPWIWLAILEKWSEIGQWPPVILHSAMSLTHTHIYLSCSLITGGPLCFLISAEIERNNCLYT